MRGWDEGEEDRKESLKRLTEAISQSRSDIWRSWRIYRRSLLAVVGLMLVMSVVTVSIFAEDIAVEHPYRNLQDTQDLWVRDYEPRRAHPFSEECDWHEQSITVDTRSSSVPYTHLRAHETSLQLVCRLSFAKKK